MQAPAQRPRRLPLLAIGALLLAALLLGGVGSIYFQYSVACGAGNFVTRLRSDRHAEAAEVKEMTAALVSRAPLRDLTVERVSGRQVVLQDPKFTLFRFTSDYPPGDPRDVPRTLRELWRSIYLKHHPGAPSTTPTNLSIVSADNSPGIALMPASCALP